MDQIRAKVMDVLRRSPFMTLIGSEVDHVAEGEVTLSVPYTASLTQFNGFIHGGVIASLADFAAGSAAAVAKPANPQVLTADIHVNYLRPAKGDRLIAAATCIKSGKSLRTAVTDVFVETKGQRTLVAKATATLMALDNTSS